jgi:preprotein translocase subunit YajC
VNVFPLLWLALMFGAFYLFLVRPQRQQVAAHRELMASLTVGDEVMTMGGIIGRISHLGDEVVDLEVSPGTSLRIARFAISQKVEV